MKDQQPQSQHAQHRQPDNKEARQGTERLGDRDRSTGSKTIKVIAS